MGSKTNISWTATHHADGTITPGSTWNPLLGCSKVSPGCAKCYAVRQSHRMASNPNAKIAAANAGLTARHANGQLDWTGRINLLPDRLDQPLRWKEPRLIFVNSLSDLFHPDVPEEFILRVFDAMRRAHWHTFQVLTKRPERMADIVSHLSWASDPDGKQVGWFAYRGTPGGHVLPNVWLGTSVEDQKAADQRLPWLLKTPAQVRFLSCEPLLGPVDLRTVAWPVAPEIAFSGVLTDPTEVDDWRYWMRKDDGIHWVIAGGESGPGYRPLNLDWARSLRDQCAAAGVPFHFKQIGGTTSKANGKMLDGQEHCAFPEAV